MSQENLFSGTTPPKRSALKLSTVVFGTIGLFFVSIALVTIAYRKSFSETAQLKHEQEALQRKDFELSVQQRQLEDEAKMATALARQQHACEMINHASNSLVVADFRAQELRNQVAAFKDRHNPATGGTHMSQDASVICSKVDTQVGTTSEYSAHLNALNELTLQLMHARGSTFNPDPYFDDTLRDAYAYADLQIEKADSLSFLLSAAEQQMALHAAQAPVVVQPTMVVPPNSSRRPVGITDIWGRTYPVK